MPLNERRQAMIPLDPHTPRILVIANRTYPCPTLTDEVARRAGTAGNEVLVIAPALNSRLRHWVSDVDDATARARHRVALAVVGLRERGINARGAVGDANPLVAIRDALAVFPATEIVIATHPRGQSNWLEHGLIEKATSQFQLPVTHVVSAPRRAEQTISA
jgi:GABA permease